MDNYLSKQKVKDLIKLKNKKFQKDAKKFIIEGEHLVVEAFKHHLLDCVIYTGELKFQFQEIPTYQIGDLDFKKMTSTINPQNIIGICNYFEVESKLPQKIIALDDLQDPGNIGTIIRTALGFNYDKVILSSNSVDKYNDKLIRASQGATFNIAIEKSELKKQLIELKSKGYDIIITSLNEKTIDASKITSKKFVLVIGNEGQGVSKEIMEVGTFFAKINISDKIESLNASVAASIMMYLLNGV